jgi:hypothetical protein
MCKEILREFPDVKIVPEKKEYYYFDGGKSETVGTVMLDVEYDSKKIKEKFNVVNKNISGKILLCNATVKKLTEKKL